ncbi:MAG TPA: adenylate/guanylate cyclase domain-containing protein [Fimbriimonas sp.]|nr:adenylate/guanylate cyclase domain-containing protein [Fimbriimonas sp.]
MESRLTEQDSVLTEDRVDQMLALAESLRAANGGQLDDSAIQAVAEATGAPIEYVRIAEKIRGEQAKKSFIANLITTVSQMDVNVRRFVASGLSSAMCAFFTAAGNKASNTAFLPEILGIVMLFWLTYGLYNACVARDSRTSAVVGSIFAGGFFLSYEIFGYVMGLSSTQAMGFLWFVPMTLAGALAGLSLQKITSRYRGQLGLKDPIRERQELLRQLQELQNKLKSGEQEVTFLSVDIVGSTKMKERADPLSVEFTFNEYYSYVDRVTRKHAGRVHSTAGDGITCAFDNPANALAAARNVSAGLLELNTFGNKIGVPIVVRQGIHTGLVTPTAGDITSVNFAHVIDISAHLQKVAPPGSIVVSDAAAARMPGGPNAIGNERVEASGVGGCIWAPKPISSIKPTGGPPPLPEIV